jgi:hypothetical protein
MNSGAWVLTVILNLKSRPEKKTQPFIRQSVKITGLGTPGFESSIENIRRLSQIITRRVPEGTMDQFTHCFFLEHSALDVGTHYFMSRKDNPMGLAAPLDHTIDPKGILASMSDDKHFYGIDNMVKYYLATEDSTEEMIR